VRADDERRVPVPAEPRLPRVGLRLDVDGLPRSPVEAHQRAVLRLRVDDVRIIRVDDGLEAVPTGRDEPIGVDDAVDRPRPRRPSDREVVLRPAVHVVERRRVVEGDLVELREREVLRPGPGRAPVVRLVQAAVAPRDQVLGVAGVDPEDVVVHVLERLSDLVERLSSVLRDLHPGVHGIDAGLDLRVDEDLLVVLRARRDVVAPLLPRPSLIGRSVEPPGLVGGLDDGVDDVGARRRDGEADPSHVLLG